MPGDSTFDQLWRKLLLYYPDLPLPLAQEFTNTAYSRALTNMDWSGLRGYGEFQIPAAYTTGTVDVVQNSDSVTGVGTTWTSAMVGRQLIVNGLGPFYTIVEVVSTVKLNLDRVYGGADASAQSYEINLAYVTLPTDFLHFTSIIDIANRWRIWHIQNQEWLDAVDAARTYTGTPSWVFAAATPSPVTATLNQVRYERWPRGVDAVTYPYSYIKQPPLMSASTDRPVFPIRGDAIREGALAELALYKGTTEKPNPYYDLGAHKLHESRFLQRVEQCKSDDEGIRQTRVWYDDDRNNWPMAPIDSKFIQRHVFF